MLEVVVVVVVLAAIFAVAGAPIALCLRAARGGWFSLVIDAVVGGLVLVTLGVSLYGWVGWPGPAVLVALWIAAWITAISWRVRLPPFAAVRGARLWLCVAWLVVLLGALALRARSVNFLPWVGDMGAYVNWANEFVRTGALHATWPPFFSSYLAISGRIFGTTATTAGVPLAGLLLVLVVARVTRAIGAGRWATVIAAAAVAVSVDAIWYSSFPASESLDAALFVAWVGCVLGILLADRRRRIAWVIAAGVLMFAIGLLRGDGPVLLAPLLLLAVLCIAVADWRSYAWRAWLAFTATLAGSLGSYWYGIERIPKYYITTQMHSMLPGPLFTAVGRLGLYLPTATTAVALIVVSGVVCTVGLLLARRYSGRTRATRAPRVLGYVLAASMVVGLGAQIAIPYHGKLYSGAAWDIVLRSGLWLTVITIALIAVIARVRVSPLITSFVLFLGSIAAIYLALQSYRLKGHSTHSFYLYWDRYLVSEYIPVTFILLGLAITVAWSAWLRALVARLRASSRRTYRALPAVVGILLALAAVVPTLPSLVLVEKDTFMAGAYSLDDQLVSLIPNRSTPILWSATRAIQAPGFVFPNTWMAFAKPMVRTFGYTVPNIQDRSSDFDPDEVLSASTLETQAVCAGENRFTVFESQLGGQNLAARVTTKGITFTPLGARVGRISLLSQPPKNGDWTHFTLTVRAWTVTIAPSLTAGQTCTT